MTSFSPLSRMGSSVIEFAPGKETSSLLNSTSTGEEDKTL